ncbi:MAG: hypothetical protein SOY43_07345 [Parabacteroides sp.]|nr:hypothetical protein [bacterium]MDY4102678.1 hypothetical protein [Parabacteroides sp.]
MLAFLAYPDRGCIIPFCTFGSGGLNATQDYLRKTLPAAQVLDGYGVRTARISRMPQELDRFLKEHGLVAGDVLQLPDFSEQQPVTEKERAIFEAACGDYKFPLGTPVTVGNRPLEDGVEYKFTATSKGKDGSEQTATILVIQYKDENSKPEFTQVIR